MKNECSIVRDLLPLYVENMVSGETKEFIEAHLSKCPECNELCISMTDKGEEDIADAEAQKKILPLRIVKQKILCKRIVTSVIAVVLALALLVGGGTLAYNIVDEHNKKAEIDYGDSELYSMEDRRAALNEILDTIYDQGFGYDIISIRFAGDAKCLEEWEQYREDSRYAPEVDDCGDFMVLYVAMKTPAWSESLEPNTYYANMKWVVARFENFHRWQCIYVNTDTE